MILAIASGKGGTGKTTVAVNLGLALSKKGNIQIVDCDVEEPNAHIFLKPVLGTPQTVNIPVPEIDEKRCNHCGRCGEICAFNALVVINTIISGKGGTGKTSFSGSFAALSSDTVFTDCDVDAANLGLIMRPTLKETCDFKASRKAFIQGDKGSRCKLCLELCRFKAITNDFKVDSFSCEGCGVCYHACPEKAISFNEVISGKWFISQTPYGPLVHARLGIAEENPGKLVTLVRNKAKEIARFENRSPIITDGPPGIGCPVIASLAGASLALVVTEPTFSAIHDMERVLSVCRYFKVSALVCINRYDLDEENAHKIEKYCRLNTVPLAGKVPFDSVVTEAMIKGLPVVEYSDGIVSKRIKEIWDSIKCSLTLPEKRGGASSEW